MKVHDVIPLRSFGEQSFLLHFWPAPEALKNVPLNLISTGLCHVTSPGHAPAEYRCIFERPGWRDLTNKPVDSVFALVKTSLPYAALATATYRFSEIGPPIARDDALAWQNAASEIGR